MGPLVDKYKDIAPIVAQDCDLTSRTPLRALTPLAVLAALKALTAMATLIALAPKQRYRKCSGIWHP